MAPPLPRWCRLPHLIPFRDRLGYSGGRHASDGWKLIALTVRFAVTVHSYVPYLCQLPPKTAAVTSSESAHFAGNSPFHFVYFPDIFFCRFVIADDFPAELGTVIESGWKFAFCFGRVVSFVMGFYVLIFDSAKNHARYCFTAASVWHQPVICVVGDLNDFHIYLLMLKI